MSKKPFQVPIQGKWENNAPYVVSIGSLIINWANNESVFMAMMQVLIQGGAHSAAIVWHSHRTTQGRMELINRLCRERLADQALFDDIQRAMTRFKGFTRTRNFYCHATYRYDTELNLRSATSITTTQEGEPLVDETRVMDVAMLNDMKFAILEMTKFNGELWKLVERLRIALGVQLEVLPQQLREPK